MRKWLTLGLAALVSIILVVVLWRIFVLLAVFGGAIALGFWLYRLRLTTRFRARWGPEKRILLVYSNSPHWQHYIESNWLPRLARHAVILNWSERARWERDGSPESKVFRYYASTREFNPLVVYMPLRGRAHVLRFWKAFRDFKHGKESSLRQAERKLFKVVSDLEQENA